MRHTIPFTLFMTAAFAMSLPGCSSPSTEPTSSTKSANHGEDGQSDMEKMKAELAKLSPEDRKTAEKQHICPVSGEMLGAMGAPQKVEVKGQTV